MGPPPPLFQTGGQQPARNQAWIIIAGIGLLLLVGLGAVKELYTEWLWFQSVTYTQVFLISLYAKIALFAGSALAFFVFFILNLWIARIIAPRLTFPTSDSDQLGLARRMTTIIMFGAGLLLAFLFGSVASGEWQRALTFINAVPFEDVDPVFSENIGFYVFILPIVRFLQMWGTGALVATLVGVVAIYGFTLSFQLSGEPSHGRSIKAHVSILGIGIFLLLALGYWLDRFDLMYSSGGVVFGPGFTDMNARLPVLTVLAGLAVVAAVLLTVNVFRRGILFPLVGVAAWTVVAIVGGGFYPEFVQRVQVEPRELARESPYLEHNIKFTRQAFGLDLIEEIPFPGKDKPSTQDILDNPETISNIRLWDHDPLRVTYNQLQALRRYYDFFDVDIDRYTLDGELRQVMLSARELLPERLALAGLPLTWVNERLVYTHGYGLTLSPVNEITEEGLPNRFVENLPPVHSPSMPELEVTRPEIYFGETTRQWVITNTDEQEVDYASEAETKYTRYDGTGGVPLDNFFKRVIFAWQMTDPNILLTALREDSQILFHRQIQERVQRIAPFLTLDEDPYLVIHRGRLVYIQDAYTVTDRYPYSEPYVGTFNYIRNSVKAVVDAHEGTVDFYISDDPDHPDPIVRTYERVFPGLFKSLEEMPEDLRAHIRYPEDFFRAQADMYMIYHMTDPRVFYSKEDAYSRPRELYLESETDQPMDSYYVIMRLPEQEKPEFLLILPFTPVEKANTNAWLAGRSDGPNYGKLLAFSFPKEKLVYGPRQIEARIDQDPEISAQLSLWDQSGSQVLRGNLLFIPIGESYLYVEPIYLQSEEGQLPELKRVIVAAGNEIVMEPNLDASLSKIFGAQVVRPGLTDGQPIAGAPSVGPDTPPAAPTAPSTEIATLARQAQKQYDTAQERLNAGDWAGYGAALQELEQTLQRMVEVAGP